MRNLSANQEGMTNPWYPPPRTSYNFVTESTPRLVLCILIYTNRKTVRLHYIDQIKTIFRNERSFRIGHDI